MGPVGKATKNRDRCPLSGRVHREADFASHNCWMRMFAMRPDGQRGKRTSPDIPQSTGGVPPSGDLLRTSR